MKSFPLKTVLIVSGGILALFLLVRFGGMSLLPDIAEGIRVDESTIPQNTALLNQRAPYFDLPDISGSHIALSDFADTPLVLVFWATSNSDAADQIKILDDYSANVEPAKQGVRILAIDSQEERSVVASFMHRGGYQITTVVDTRGATSEAYALKSVPTFFFLDRDGTIRETYTGLLSAKTIGEKIEHILQ